MSTRCRAGVACVLLAAGCGGGGNDAAAGHGGAAATGSGGTNAQGGAVEGGGGGLGAPENTFTLPVPSAAAGKMPELYYPDLAQKFPDVAWATLDRLYIPAGK